LCLPNDMLGIYFSQLSSSHLAYSTHKADHVLFLDLPCWLGC